MTENVVKPLTILIDGDLAIFSICAAVEYGREPEDVNFSDIIRAIDGKMDYLMSRTGATSRRIFLTDKYNFRTTVMEEYKANRDGVWRPYHLKNAQAYVRAAFDAESVVGLEADDLMAMNQKLDGSTIIATIDKDLLQVPGRHYKWETQHRGEEFIDVDKFGGLTLTCKPKGKTIEKDVKGTGALFFCHQLLIGDGTDGVIGCGVTVDRVYASGKKAGQPYQRREGVGAVTSYELLKNVQSYSEGLQKVIAEYKKVFGKDWERNLQRNGRALYMTKIMVPNGKGENCIKLWNWTSKEQHWLNLSTRQEFTE